MTTHDTEAIPKTAAPKWLLTGFWICVVIAIGAVIRRLVVLAHPSPNAAKQMVDLDAAFASHAVLTALHIVPAAIFVILAAVILVRRTTNGVFLKQLFFLFGAVTGVTAYLMSAFAVGGGIERSAVYVFDSYFMFSLGRAYLWHLRNKSLPEREWMLRAVGILLGIATTRPVMGMFFATSTKTGLAPTQFFGIAFWIGFSINALVIEFWLHSRRRAENILRS
jgi:hypothetical protein